MKKLFALVLSLAMIFALVACGTNNSGGSTNNGAANDGGEGGETSAFADLKVGFIFLHDENSTYDLNFINAAKAACENLGVTDYVLKTNVPEGQECYDAAAELADDGCDIIFADSFGHEDFMIQAAKDFPDVQFCHSTGTKAHTEGLDNYHNAFASIYEGRYLAGIVAGMKLNAMIDAGEITADQAKLGYVGAFTYAEVVSGYTSFFLGARSVCPSATMEVKYTNSWASFDLEKEAADALISDGCVLISQHADTTGAPTACEAAGVPCVGYNISMIATAPTQALTSASNDWGAYVTYAVQCMVDGTPIPVDWCKGFSDGAVRITELNEAAVAPGTAEKVEEVEAQLASGELHVFDTSTWTVNGETLTTYKKEGSDLEYISDGYFHESEFASAPAFDILIDGITTIDN